MKLVGLSAGLAAAASALSSGVAALTLRTDSHEKVQKKHHHHHRHHKKHHKHGKHGWTFKSAGTVGFSSDSTAMQKMMKDATVTDASASTPYGWTVNAADFANSMTLTAVIEVNGIEPPAGTLAAFVGSECRGVQAAPLSPPFGPFAGKQM